MSDFGVPVKEEPRGPDLPCGTLPGSCRARFSARWF